MPNKRPEPPELEISWRTEELGPETRRRLFEKLVPSSRPAAGRDHAAPPGKRERGDKPKTPKSPKADKR